MNKSRKCPRYFLFIILLMHGIDAIGQGNENWDDSFANGPSNLLTSIDSIFDQVVVGGFSFFIDGVYYPHIGKWDQSSRKWSQLGTGLDDPVNSVHISGASVYVGGLFDNAGSEPASRVAVFNLQQEEWSPLGAGVTNFGGGSPPYVNSIVSIGSEVFVGGVFDMAGNVSAQNVASWDSVNKEWSSLGGGIEGEVNTLAVAGNDLYVGGTIVSASGVPAINVARWNNLNKTWAPLGEGVGEPGDLVRDMVIVRDELYVCGIGFESAGGISVGGPQARWNINTETWSSVGDGFLKSTYSIAADDRYVYAGFSATSGGPNVLRWDIQREEWEALGSGVLGDPLGMVATPYGLYVVGGFNSAGGKPSMNIARYILEVSAGIPNWKAYD